MVISQYSFVGYDHGLLTLILCGILTIASIGIWFWHQKPPIALLLGLITLAAMYFIRPPDSIVNLAVVVGMGIGAGIESKYLKPSRGFLWVLAYAVWTVGNLIYDFNAPHWLRLRQDTLIDQRGDLMMILKRPAVHVYHATRRVKQIGVKMEFWSIQDKDQAIQLFGDELYADLAGHLHTGPAVAAEVAKWTKTKIVDKTLAPQELPLTPWNKN